MKLLFADNEAIVAEAGFGCLPDSCLLRNNEHFYIPNFSSEIEAYACLVLKITKLGKYFAPQFASRYYSGYTLGIDMRAATDDCYSDALRRGFDKSMPIGEFAPIPVPFDSGFTFSYNGVKTNIPIAELSVVIDRYCSKLSEYYTFKIGDLVVISLAKLAEKVVIGDKFEAEMPGQRLEALVQ